ncbi:YeeE/YedE thiosulfate transporter family protein [uncultured Paracoccus sp.]|uniref:YeeE/YedE thiosulfate transporter family protein n=1 Tax=uncultured Paracoccus sp. TaxID=189685 RepID=UPI002603587F|nr:YeeE/YedE thiosulfate transporter family protein [uncultured Paracoccus sp.]
MQIVLAIILGAAFGAVLDRIGATNPSILNRMLALRDLRLAKAIMLGIGVFSILTFAGQMLGLVDVGHMSVKAANAGVFLGGVLLGIGWAVSGYCPGTAVCAVGAGRRDAIGYVFGGLLGALAFTLVYDAVTAMGLLDGIAGGKVTLGPVPGSEYGGVLNIRGDVLGIIMGLIFVAVAFVLPERLRPAPVVGEPVRA